MTGLGRFRIEIRVRFDNPAFPQYVVYVGAKMIGRQFSVPTRSDCEWLERQQALDRLVYAEASARLSDKGREHTIRGIEKARIFSWTARRYKLARIEEEEST